MNATATMWAAGVAMRLRTMQAGPIMQMPVFLILFFAPVYVPLSLLDGWIHGVAVVNPMTRVIEPGAASSAGRRPRWSRRSAPPRCSARSSRSGRSAASARPKRRG